MTEKQLDPSDSSQFVAAVDLGSNSFHLVIGNLDSSGRLIIIDRIREIVRLGGGLDANSNITVNAQNRALDCLRRIGQRLREIPASNIRAVGTNTFRKAKNAHHFLINAQNALGHDIEVITGREEARLIFESVCYGDSIELADKILVADIGGGSTEIIAGHEHSPNIIESLYIGCVSLTKKHFANGRISMDRLQRAEQEAQLEMRSVRRQFCDHGWNKTIGCSGTIRAVGNAICSLNPNHTSITSDSLNSLQDKLLECRHTSDLVDLGFEMNRCEVLPGGFAIVCAMFKQLNIESMEISDLALREGVLYDLLGRLRNNDARERTVNSLIDHWSIDRKHANRVRTIALKIYDQIEPHWFENYSGARRLLGWASMLHEIGLSISHTKYQDHGAYILEFSDMAGFSRYEQLALGILVRWHRRKLPEHFPNHSTHLPKRILKRLCIVLRIATLLHRPRTDRLDLRVTCRVNTKRIELIFPENWLNQHPLTRADLIQEKQYLKKVGFELRVHSNESN